MDKSLQKVIAFGIVVAVFIAVYYYLYLFPKLNNELQQKANSEAQAQQAKQSTLKDCIARWDKAYYDGITKSESMSTETMKWFEDLIKSKKDDCYKLYK